jgi:hypothetical protein
MNAREHAEEAGRRAEQAGRILSFHDHTAQSVEESNACAMAVAAVSRAHAAAAEALAYVEEEEGEVADMADLREELAGRGDYRLGADGFLHCGAERSIVLGATADGVVEREAMVCELGASHLGPHVTRLLDGRGVRWHDDGVIEAERPAEFWGVERARRSGL